MLAPLAARAERLRVAVLAVMHVTKDSQRRAIYPAAGSIAFDEDGPAGLVWATDPVTGFEADGLLGPGSSEESSERNEAETLLRELLCSVMVLCPRTRSSALHGRLASPSGVAAVPSNASVSVHTGPGSPDFVGAPGIGRPPYPERVAAFGHVPMNSA